MSRYFFNLRQDGETISDIEGDDFPDAETARVSAVNAVREMAAALIKNGQDVADAYMDVSDDNGRLLFSVSFHDVVQNHLRK